MKKQLDLRIPALIGNATQSNERSLFVLVGDRSRDQIVNLFWLQKQAQMNAPVGTVVTNKSASLSNVLWCYKSDLGFTSHRKKRESKIKRDVKRGIRDVNEQSPFELFIGTTDIRYCYYKDTEAVLGQTFSMLILQDFEAITPNILARTIETVRGGGSVVIMLRTMSSLRQLYTMSMDVHAKFASSASADLVDSVARFNERFLLSLTACNKCLILDDEMNVLPISNGKHIQSHPTSNGKSAGQNATQANIEGLKKLKEDSKGTKVLAEVLGCTATLDQGKALLSFIDAIASKTLASTVTLTAARGRGKSATLGLAIAAALAYGYSNIFLTSPTPENLKTVFEFILKGLDALGWSEHSDYNLVQSTNPEFKNTIVRINCYKFHRQTIQYVQPQDAHVLGQAELVVIDEAAAIPLPLVRKLIGPYLVFLSSTINGYEGTGRSLSLKLIKQLRESTRPTVTLASATKDAAADASTSVASSGARANLIRSLKEISLDESIRYAPGDAVEKWLNGLLCLNASVSGITRRGAPHPSKCELFMVNRDTLFSFHPASETFLQRMMALYVASHYKNSPNDLQLMSDAPAHRLFVLLPPISDDEQSLPEPLVVLQVALEGRISKAANMLSLERGQGASGDLIPWTISRHFQDANFATMSGARIVRIATHPDYMSMGYGRKAIDLLESFYKQELLDLDEVEDDDEGETLLKNVLKNTIDGLHSEKIGVRDVAKMPPLLQRLSEVKPERLDYLGVSFGLTGPLLRFWGSRSFAPLYIRLQQTDITGEHSCVMIKSLQSAEDQTWLHSFADDFRKRFFTLLSYKLKDFTASTSINVLQAIDGVSPKQPQTLTSERLHGILTPYDIKRLGSYCSNLLDHNAIADLLPSLGKLYFTKSCQNVELSRLQASILLALSFQRKTMDEISTELELPVSQILAIFMKIISKINTSLRQVEKLAIEERIPVQDMNAIREKYAPIAETLEQELQDAGSDALQQVKSVQRELIDTLNLSQYELPADSANWSAVENQIASSTLAPHASTTLSLQVEGEAPASSSKRPRDSSSKSASKKSKGSKSRK